MKTTFQALLAAVALCGTTAHAAEPAPEAASTRQHHLAQRERQAA